MYKGESMQSSTSEQKLFSKCRRQYLLSTELLTFFLLFLSNTTGLAPFTYHKQIFELFSINSRYFFLSEDIMKSQMANFDDVKWCHMASWAPKMSHLVEQSTRYLLNEKNNFDIISLIIITMKTQERCSPEYEFKCKSEVWTTLGIASITTH